LTGSQNRDGWVLPERLHAENRGKWTGKNMVGLRDLPAADAYLFDIDGTLLNSRDGVHYNAFRNAIREVFGIETRLDNIPVHGNTDLGIIRAILEKAGRPAELEAGLPRALELMRAEVEKNIAGISAELCPSIRRLVETLHGEGKILGVASGNLESIGWAKITVAGLRPFFNLGSFSDRRERRVDIFRHGIEQAQALLARDFAEQRADLAVCVVGDTPFDIQAAHANNVPVVAVATGIYGYEELLSHDPDLCLHCCTDLFEPSRI
jgi:phosphoglycolate phosphatase-like HAD superfamily hydrolase